MEMWLGRRARCDLFVFGPNLKRPVWTFSIMDYLASAFGWPKKKASAFGHGWLVSRVCSLYTTHSMIDFFVWQKKNDWLFLFDKKKVDF